MLGHAVREGDLFALVAVKESSRASTGGIPSAAALNTPRWSSSPSAMTMQFSAQDGTPHTKKRWDTRQGFMFGMDFGREHVCSRALEPSSVPDAEAAAGRPHTMKSWHARQEVAGASSVNMA